MRFFRHGPRSGLSTVEYALLLVLIVIVVVTAWTTLGGNVVAQRSPVVQATEAWPTEEPTAKVELPAANEEQVVPAPEK